MQCLGSPWSEVSGRHRAIAAGGCRPVSEPGVAPHDWSAAGYRFCSCQQCSHPSGLSATIQPPSPNLHNPGCCTITTREAAVLFAITFRRAGHPSLEMHQQGLVVLLSTLASSRVAAAGSLPRGVGPECKSNIQTQPLEDTSSPMDPQPANSYRSHSVMMSQPFSNDYRLTRSTQSPSSSRQKRPSNASGIPPSSSNPLRSMTTAVTVPMAPMSQELQLAHISTHYPPNSRCLARQPEPPTSRMPCPASGARTQAISAHMSPSSL